MKYLNAAEVLPEKLLAEIQEHVSGEILYIPSGNKYTKWGDRTGSRNFYKMRNQQIKQQYQNGFTIEQISHDFGLAYETVRKIIYKF